MSKLDLTKLYKSYYKAKPTPEIIEIEAAKYLSITGKGDPSSEDFLNHIQALYPVAYTIKFKYKGVDKDFTVAKLEGQWWFDMQKYKGATIDTAPKLIPRSEWEYRLLIRLPDFVSKNDVDEAKEIAFAKKGTPLINEVHYFEMNEGKCVQMLHVGSYGDEPVSLKIMDAFMKEHNFDKAGHHHEIYLSDFRKVAPEKLRTILREPVK